MAEVEYADTARLKKRKLLRTEQEKTEKSGLRIRGELNMQEKMRRFSFLCKDY